MRILLCSMCFIFPAVPLLQAQEQGLSLKGWVSTGATRNNGPSSWLNGMGGKFNTGQIFDPKLFADLQVQLKYRPNSQFGIVIHGLARQEPDVLEGRDFGLVQAFLEANVPRNAHQFQFKLGLFFPPTSMENTDPLWRNPYTLTLSAINTWLAEEIRHTGLDLRYSFDASKLSVFTEATLLSGNDSMGSLIAWRGWSFGRRISVWNETLPLPNLKSLLDTGPFGVQNDQGTQPINRDLDNSLGVSARFALEWSTGLVTSHYLRTNGDRGLHMGEYAWETSLYQLGFTLTPNSWLTLLGEGMDGETGMGLLQSPHVQSSFQSWYLLSSVQKNRIRFSLRYDSFQTRDLDKQNIPINADFNEENGKALTAAVLFQMSPAWRLGLEWLKLDNDRLRYPNQPEIIALDATNWTAELEFRF